MAKRPVFLASKSSLVEEKELEFEWHPGFAVSQKQKNIMALHEAAMSELGIGRLLEVSTKSPDALGRALSAFSLRVSSTQHPEPLILEAAFQGSKVFEKSGQQMSLYELTSGKAVRQALAGYSSEPISGFRFDGHDWALQPRTAFYDWLYLRALMELAERKPELVDELHRYGAFTDIEFNPKRSINCQARSCALYISLVAEPGLADLLREPAVFVSTLEDRGYGAPEEDTLFD